MLARASAWAALLERTKFPLEECARLLSLLYRKNDEPLPVIGLAATEILVKARCRVIHVSNRREEEDVGPRLPVFISTPQRFCQWLTCRGFDNDATFVDGIALPEENEGIAHDHLYGLMRPFRFRSPHVNQAGRTCCLKPLGDRWQVLRNELQRKWLMQRASSVVSGELTAHLLQRDGQHLC